MSNFVALVVEDDPFERVVMADLLRKEGLEVLECSTAAAAELVVVRAGAELRALVADMSLPGDTSGIELAVFAKRRFPHLNVVMISSRGPSHIPDDIQFLRKPYQPERLLEAVLA